MYKVFIDQKPIIFISKDDLSTKTEYHKSKDFDSTDDIKELLGNVTIDEPLVLVNKNPKKEFKRLFEDHKKIEAAGGIVQRKKSFLVIKRKGRWDIPKGGIDKGESPEDACVREIMEECGIFGHEIVQPLTETYHVMKWNGKKALKRTYWFMLTYSGTKKTKPQAKEDITDAVWMKEDEMLAIRSNTYGSISVVLEAYSALPKKSEISE